MEEISRPMIETYELTLRHFVYSNGKRIEYEEPKVYQVSASDGIADSVSGYKNHLLDELFYRMRREVGKNDK